MNIGTKGLASAALRDGGGREKLSYLTRGVSIRGLPPNRPLSDVPCGQHHDTATAALSERDEKGVSAGITAGNNFHLSIQQGATNTRAS